MKNCNCEETIYSKMKKRYGDDCRSCLDTTLCVEDGKLCSKFCSSVWINKQLKNGKYAKKGEWIKIEHIYCPFCGKEIHSL